MQRRKHSSCQGALPCPAHTLDAAADASAGLSHLLVGRTLDSLLKIHQPRADENRMGVRIHKAGRDNFPGAIDFGNLLTILFQPGVAEGVFGRAYRNNLAANTEHGAVCDDSEFPELLPATRARFVRNRVQREKLPDVDQ